VSPSTATLTLILSLSRAAKPIKVRIRPKQRALVPKLTLSKDLGQRICMYELKASLYAARF
jgi:hypothetical protein